MQRIVHVGALVTINHWQRRMWAADVAGLDDSVANFCALLFAKTDAGDLITGPALGLGIPRDVLSSERFYAFVPTVVAQHPPAPLAKEHGHVYYERWERLAAALADHEVRITGCELIDKPFETLIDGELRELLIAADARRRSP